MGIENGGNFREVEEAKEVAKGSGVEQEVTPEQMEGSGLKEPEVLVSVDKLLESAITSVVSSTEEVHKSGGFAEWIKNTKEKVSALVESIKEKIVDYKVKKAIRDSNYGKGIHLHYTELREIIQTLSVEQLNRHPEIIKKAKAEFLRVLKDESEQTYHDENSYNIKSMHFIVDLFKEQPEIANEILNDPEVGPLQEKAFLACLFEPGTQHGVAKFGNSLYIDASRSRELVLYALKDTVTSTRNTNIHDYIYNVKLAIEDFGIEKTDVLDLAFLSVQTILKGDYPYNALDRIKREFGLSDEDINFLIEDKKEELEELIYVAASNLLIKSTGDNISGLVRDFLSRAESEFNNINLNEEGFKKYLEKNPQVEERVQEAVKEGIISRLVRGDIVSAKAIRDEFGVSKEKFQEIKTRLLEKNPQVEERVQEAAKEAIISLLKSGNIDSAKEIRDEFGVSEERFQEIKTRSEEIKKRIEMVGDFSKMIDNNFLDLLDTEEQESGLELNEKQEIISALNEFMRKNHFRDKGRTIFTLMMAKERGKISSEEPLAIWEVLEKVKVQIEQYESIIQQGYSNNVPSGIRASIGMEYEVTSSVVQEYENQNYSSYKNDVQLLSKYAHIGQGADASHEFAFQPTDNPYLVILELKLLQDLGFIDLNFSKYPKAARGYHITLGGEFGMSREVHAYFLQNMLSCANFLGVNAGKSITSSKGIDEKGYDFNHSPLFSSELKPMAEFKSFACDKFEMFERAILTSHNATIAIQAANKYTTIDSFERIDQLRPNFPQNSELFYSQLQTSGLLKEEIKNLRIREIIFSWFRLQVESLNLIEDHNQNFLDNETIGYFDGNNDWVEARDFAKRNNRLEFEEYLNRVNKIRGTQNQRPYSNLEEYFQELQVSPEGFFRELNSGLINIFKDINNLSLKTGEVTEGKTDEIAFDQANLSSTMITKIGNKIEDLPGYPNKPEEMSIFDRNGMIREGYYTFQGFSEKMITHKAQTLLLEFNRRMSQIINQKEVNTTIFSNIGADNYDFAA